MAFYSCGNKCCNKSSPIFFQNCPKVATVVVTIKVTLIKTGQKLSNIRPTFVWRYVGKSVKNGPILQHWPAFHLAQSTAKKCFNKSCRWLDLNGGFLVWEPGCRSAGGLPYPHLTDKLNVVWPDSNLIFFQHLTIYNNSNLPCTISAHFGPTPASFSLFNQIIQFYNKLTWKCPWSIRVQRFEHTILWLWLSSFNQQLSYLLIQLSPVNNLYEPPISPTVG